MKAVERSLWVLHDKAIRKVVFLRKDLYSHLSSSRSRPSVSWQLEPPSTSRKLFFGQTSSQTPNKCWKAEKFWIFLASFSATDGRHLELALASLGSLQSTGLDGGGSLPQILSSILPPPTCVAGTHRFAFLQLEVCDGLSLGTSRSVQDARERGLGDFWEFQARVWNWFFFA